MREMLRFAPEYVGEPAKCVYRIYRDTRFSKDKTPYKTYVSALLLRNNFDKYAGSAAYYFAVSPENIEVAGGIYTPDRDVLLAVRQHVAENHKEFRATFENAESQEAVGRVVGREPDPRSKGLRCEPSGGGPDQAQTVSARRELDPKLATTPKLFGEIVTRIEAMTPFIEFLNRPLLRRQAKQKRDEKFLR